MSALLRLKWTMPKTSIEKIDGAPDWVQEFFVRIADRDDVRDEKEEEVHKRMIRGMDDLAESLGSLQGAVGGLDKKFEYLRKEVRSVRRSVAEQGTRLEALDEELHEVHEQIDQLNQRVEELEGQIKVLRDGETTPAT